MRKKKKEIACKRKGVSESFLRSAEEKQSISYLLLLVGP